MRLLRCNRRHAGTFLYQNGSNRSFSFIQLSLDDKTLLSGSGLLSAEHFGSQKDHPADRRYLRCSLQIPERIRCFRPSPPESVHRRAPVYTLYVCAWFIDLIDRNDDLNAGCFCMVDCLNGLRHHTAPSAATITRMAISVALAHAYDSGECLPMSRGIEERNLLFVDRTVYAPMLLGNTASLAVGDMVFRMQSRRDVLPGQRVP